MAKRWAVLIIVTLIGHSLVLETIYRPSRLIFRCAHVVFGERHTGPSIMPIATGIAAQEILSGVTSGMQTPLPNKCINIIFSKSLRCCGAKQKPQTGVGCARQGSIANAGLRVLLTSRPKLPVRHGVLPKCGASVDRRPRQPFSWNTISNS